MKNLFKVAIVGALGIGLSISTFANELTITTGSEGGGYFKRGGAVGDMIDKQFKGELEVIVEESNGSKENLERFNDGDAQIAIVQRDALNLWAPSRAYMAKTADREVVYFFANKHNKVKDLEDIEGKKDYVLVIAQGSGAEVTLRNFVKEDSGYQNNLDSVVWADDLYDAFDMASEPMIDGKKVAGVLTVSKPGKFSSELLEDFGDKFEIAELTDGDFDDAKVNDVKLYQECELDKRLLGGFGKVSWGDIDTICMDSVVIYDPKFGDKKLQKAIKRGVTKGIKKHI